MNIYLLNGTETAYLPAHLLVEQIPIKGLIGLANSEANRKNNEYYDYSSFCAAHGIEYVGIESYSMSNEADKKLLSSLDVDIVLSVSWQRLIPEWFIRHCQIGVVGFHGSPDGIHRGRGRSPQNWALLLGRPHFSCSIFWIDPGIDSGDVIDTFDFDYTEVDDIFTSYIKAGLSMTEMMVRNFRNGNLEKRHGIPQNHEESLYLPQRTAKDGQIDWHRGSRQLYDFIRALTRPYPGAFTIFDHREIKIWAAKYIDIASECLPAAKPGEVLLRYPGGELLVQCGEGLLLVTDYECENEPPEQGAVFQSASFASQMEEIASRHREKHNLPLSPSITRLLAKAREDTEN